MSYTRQRGNAGAGQGLHLDARLMMHTHDAADHRGIAVEINGDAAVLEPKGVAERNQFMGALAP